MKKKEEKNSITVYWAPHSIAQDGGTVENWNMLYEDPQTVFQYTTQFDIKDGEEDSMIKCPAFANLTKNMYAWTWPVDSSYTFKAHSNKVHQIEIIPTSKHFIAAHVPRDQTLTLGPSINFSYMLHMFAEEPLEIQLTSPYLQKVEYLKSGYLTSGQFDIGQWFRTLNTEIQMYGNEGEIHFKKGEPVFYVKFLTNKKIVLKRFELTPELDTYSRKCINAKHVLGYRMPLSESYGIFNRSRTREIVLKNIKENLI
jgi:hypothetical protein